MDWLKKPVFLDEGDAVVVSRAQSFRIFMEEAIVPFLAGYGYVLYSPKVVCNDLANWVHSGIDPKLPEHRNHSYDRDMYDHRLDSEAWEAFWDKWGSFADFANESSLQNELHEFLWVRMDLDYSSASADIDELLAWEESENPGQKDEPGFSNDIGYVKDRHSLY